MEILNVIESNKGITTKVTSFFIKKTNKLAMIEKATELFRKNILYNECGKIPDELLDKVTEECYFSDYNGYDINITYTKNIIK